MAKLFHCLRVMILSIGICEGFLNVGRYNVFSIRSPLMMKVDDIAILHQAAELQNIERAQVINSILLLEKKSTTFEMEPDSLRGRWKLVFTSIPGGAANGFLIGGFFDGYFAISEVVDLYACSLDTNFLSGFRGPPSKVVSKSPLVIEYLYTNFKVGPILNEIPPNVRSFSFIYVDDVIAVARTSTGAATLLRRL